MIPKEVLITSQDLVDWIDRPPSNDDLDLCNYLENAVKNQYKYKNVIDKIKKEVLSELQMCKPKEMAISMEINYIEEKLEKLLEEIE